MNNTLSSEPNDHHSYDNDRRKTQDTLDDNINTNLRRYSRSKLYALRNDAQSQKQPVCAQRSELQSLSFWKIQMSVSGQSMEHLTGNSGGGYGDGVSNTNTGCPIVLGTHYSSSTRARERQVNFRDRPANSTRGLKMTVNAMDNSLSHSPLGFTRGLKYTGNSIEVSATHSSTSNQKTSFLDQRSNAIAHLMPAFAKKRFVAVTQQSVGSHTPLKMIESQEHDVSNRNSSFDTSSRSHRGKEHLYEKQKRLDDNGEYTSPNRKSFNEPERESGGNGLISSPNARHTNSLSERRIGSGRLIPRDVNWEYHDKNNIGHRNNSRFIERTSNVTGNSSIYNEKRSADRRNGSGILGTNENSASSPHSTGRRFNSDEHTRSQRRIYNEKSDEPEWFSGGPTSQNDTIELRGFDDPSDDNLNEKEEEKLSQERQQSSEESIDIENIHSENSPTNRKEKNKDIDCKEQKNTPDDMVIQNENSEKSDSDLIQQKPDMSKEFNFDAFDAIECQKDIPVSGKSRFTCWFTNNDEQDDAINLKSPDLTKETPKTINIMELFQHAKGPAASPGDVRKVAIPSVEELEARMRQIGLPVKTGSQEDYYNETLLKGDVGNTMKQPQSPRDIEAFQKILNQLKSVEAKNEVFDPDRQSNCLASSPLTLEAVPRVMMLPPDMHRMTPQLMVTPGGPAISNPEEIKRIIQLHHQSQLQSMSPSHQIDSTSIIHHISDVFPDHQQKRSDFLNLMHAVTRGQIHLIVLEKELNNPNTPNHTKEIISAVLQESARNLTPATNNQSVQLPTTQVMCSSPIHHQSISSPIPMAMIPPHTTNPNNQMLVQTTSQQNSIGILNPEEMHIRTLKKKVEEQQQYELNKRRIELHKQQLTNNSQQLQQLQQSPQHQSQNPTTSSTVGQQPRHLNSPTPLAFTPTSVLRKRTAEKDNSNPQQPQQPQLHPQPQIQVPQHQKILPQLRPNSPNQGVFINQCQQPLLPVLSQPRMILGGSHPSPQMMTGPQTQTMQPLPSNLQQRLPPNDIKWQINLGSQGNIPPNKPIGRPILKGPPPPMAISTQVQPPPIPITQQMQLLGQNQPAPPPHQQVPSMLFPTKVEMQQQMQQQRLKNETPKHMLNQQMSQGFAASQHLQQLPQAPQNIMHIPHQPMFQLHHMTLQQQQHMQLQRQLHQQHHPQPQPKTQPQIHHESTNRPANFPQPQPKVSNSAEGINSEANVLVYSRDGLSPTSNQLAQWFSPELLAQASAGKLPQINVNQALSLEDFERSIQQHSSTVVHN